jgi:uncharacterized repeat protein (TIGR01451 family)
MFRLSARIVVSLALCALLLPALTGTPASATRAAQTQPQASVQAALTIPSGQNPVELDGICSDEEYGDAISQTFDDAGEQGQVLLKHDGQMLYVCIRAQPGTFDERFASVYLDPQGDGADYQFAQEDDYSLRVPIPGNTNTSLSGTGVANGYTQNTAIDDFWQGVAATGEAGESIEYSISVGRFFLGNCQLFGIAAYHHWVTAVGDDYGWPSNRFFDQPRTWRIAQLEDPGCTDRDGRIAYVYRGDTADATSFFNFLTGNGYAVDLVPLGNVLSTDFSQYDLIMIADDSGNLSQWGIPGDTTAQVNQIIKPNRPILGLGEGGYAFFGQLSLFIGWPNGWHGPEDSVLRASSAPLAYYAGIPPDPVQVYSEPVNEVGIYLDNTETLPTDVVPIGLEPPSPDHASLIIQDCRHLWGFSGNPREMTGTGEDLFLNAVGYALTFQCATPETPPEECISITKSADPADGTPVAPGDVIEYTVTYTFSDNPECENPDRARLIDIIPEDTIYVPGSASDGIDPTADGALVWSVTPASGPQTKTFKVRVSDTQCNNQRRVNNQARLITGVAPPELSNLVSHPVECPPISFPNDEPPYAESEIRIEPYPLVTGQPSTISVKVSNDSASSQTMTVSFQTSPNRFGIGLDFNTFDSQVVTVPPNGNVIVETTFTPVSSGHYCIQIVVEVPGMEPLVTQRNLDVTEDLTPGEPDDLVFQVGNPTNATADVTLVVDNTCPGWTAVVSPNTLSGMAPGEVRNATLTVTPPDPATLGSGCYIDVQGWIDDQLIGGIRKLDVPPVHLPPNVDPPWMEREISVIPDPPIAGQPAQICVELQNPLPVTRTVTLDYAVADFGAGIYFTSIGEQEFTLPPNSIDKYCIDWTPDAGGTLHRCILVTLKQANYEDQTSQRNINLIRVKPDDLGTIDVPVRIGNPDLVQHTLQISPTIYGIQPFWELNIVDENGNPPPEVLEPGQVINLQLQFTPNAALANTRQATPPGDFRYGDESRVEVAVLLDGVTTGGFSLNLETSRVLLPIIVR